MPDAYGLAGRMDASHRGGHATNAHGGGLRRGSTADSGDGDSLAVPVQVERELTSGRGQRRRGRDDDRSRGGGADTGPARDRGGLHREPAILSIVEGGLWRVVGRVRVENPRSTATVGGVGLLPATRVRVDIADPHVGRWQAA